MNFIKFANSSRKMRRYELGLFTFMSIFSTLTMKIRLIISTSPASRPITRYEYIFKRTNDQRSYRGLKLNNDLEILLISSPNSSTASATMNIGVGSLNDYDELPGIAQLVGETLNRSSSTMNPGDEFADVINSELSVSVVLPDTFPITEEDKQIFHFEIDVNYLIPALEIFARIFNEPLFLTSNSRNQLVTSINHVDWRYSRALLNEVGNKWRFLQLEKSISSENHPFNHSPYGDSRIFLKYLAEGEVGDQLDGRDFFPTRLHDKLREFYYKWYSSNVMCLVVLGKETLDQLESVTVPLFENIRNRHVEKLIFPYEKHPWGQEQLRRYIYSAFDSDALSSGIVRLVFRVPDIRDQYKTAPELYLKELLMRGGPGSLISVLEKRNLCDYIKAKYDLKAGIGFFVIKCEVPLDAEMREGEIVSSIFQYIRLLHKNGIQEWIFKDNKIRHEFSPRTNFPFVDNTEYISSIMHDYPLEDILIHKCHQTEWKPSLIEEFLKYIIPDNVNVFIDGEKFQGITEEQNKWHGIRYKVEMIPEHSIEKWKTADVSPDFRIPPPNEFLPTNWDILPLEIGESETPQIVHSTPKSQFWFSQDNESSHVQIRLTLMSLSGYRDPSYSVLLCIFSHLWRHLMVEYAYALEISEYRWSFLTGKISIEMRLDGFPDKIQIVLKKIMSKITSDHIAGSHLQEPFERAKVKCIDKEKNHRKHLTAMHRLEYVLTEAVESWSSDEIVSVSRSLQLKDYEKFIRKMLSRVFIQGLIFGNCVKKNAMNIARIIEALFEPNVKWIPRETTSLLPRVVELEAGKHFVDILFRSVETQLHVHFIFYQLGVGTDQNNYMATFLLYMIRSKCNIILDQNRIFRIYNVIGLVVATSRARDHPDYVDKQFENCLKEIHVMLREMSDTKFEEYVKYLILEESNYDMFRVETYWNDITRGLYDSFQNFDKQYEDTKFITRMDVLWFFEDKLYEHSLNRRKYTILIISKNSEWASSSNFIPDAIKIEDVITFRNDSNLFSSSITRA